MFDVLEYIAYTKPPVSRSARVAASLDNILHMLNAEQREFVEYVLRNYIDVGVDELDVGKLGTILTAKYGGINAAQQKLGTTDDIRETFIEFQKHLYKVA